MYRRIGDLLDASAINAGQMALHRQLHPVIDVVDAAVGMFQSEASARNVDLRARALLDEGTLFCDRDRIVQVLAYLIGNALRLTPPDGCVDVVASREHGRVRIDVEDTGPGIPEEQVPTLFDRYWRGEPRRAGAGLGLFIARGIIAAHGGTIGVATAVGAGSRFFFALPEAP